MRKTKLIPKTSDAFKFLGYVVSRSDSDFLKPQIICEGGKLSALVLLKNGYIVYDLSKRFDVVGDDFSVSVVDDRYFKILDEVRSGVIEVVGGKFLIKGSNYEYLISVEEVDEVGKIEFEDFAEGVLLSDLKKYTKYVSWLDYRKVHYAGINNFYFFGDEVVFTNGYVMVVLKSDVRAELVVPFEVKDYIYDEDVLCRKLEAGKLAFKGKDFYGVLSYDENARIREIYTNFGRMNYIFYSFVVPELPVFKRDDEVFIGILKDGSFVCEGLDYDYRFRLSGVELQDDVHFTTELNQIFRHFSGKSVVFGVDYFTKTCLISRDGMTVYSVLRRKM